VFTVRVDLERARGEAVLFGAPPPAAPLVASGARARSRPLARSASLPAAVPRGEWSAAARERAVERRG